MLAESRGRVSGTVLRNAKVGFWHEADGAELSIRGLVLDDKRTSSDQVGEISPRLQRGCSFLPQPGFAGFIWSASGFAFQCADEAERDAHSDALE